MCIPWPATGHRARINSGWIDSYLHGGVTSMISAGEVHTPGARKMSLG